MVTAGCDYWATDPALARSIIAFAVTDPAAADILTGHDAGRLRLLDRVVARLPEPVPAGFLDTLWLLTGFAAYDDLTQGRGLSTAAAAALLADLAEHARAELREQLRSAQEQVSGRREAR